MRIVILANAGIGLFKFRKELVEKLCKEHEVFIVLPEDEFTESFISLGCNFIKFEFNRRGTNPIADLNQISRYKKILKDIEPDIVLTYTIKPNIYGGLACQSTHIPYIANVTGLGTTIENGGLMSFISTTLYKIGLKKASCVFFQNKENRKLFEDKKIVKGKTRLIPGSGVNLSTHYSGIIVDEETQHPLMSYIKPSDKEHILRFRYPAPQVKRYQQLWIKVDTVTESAKKMLFCEVQKARRVKQLLETELCEKEKAAQLEQLRKKAIAVFAKMSAVEKELMQYSKRYEAGELTEEDYSEQYQSSLLKQNEMNATLQTHMTAMEEVETVFSSKNPWLELYANLQIGEHFDKRELKKYISKVLVYRFETASVEFIHVKWRDRLPKLWLEETR